MAGLFEAGAAFSRGWYFYPAPSGPGDFACPRHGEELLRPRMGALVWNHKHESEYIVYLEKSGQH